MEAFKYSAHTVLQSVWFPIYLSSCNTPSVASFPHNIHQIPAFCLPNIKRTSPAFQNHGGHHIIIMMMACISKGCIIKMQCHPNSEHPFSFSMSLVLQPLQCLVISPSSSLLQIFPFTQKAKCPFCCKYIFAKLYSMITYMILVLCWRPSFMNTMWLRLCDIHLNLHYVVSYTDPQKLNCILLCVLLTSDHPGVLSSDETGWITLINNYTKKDKNSVRK